jgi:hypothetical protein
MATTSGSPREGFKAAVAERAGGSGGSLGPTIPAKVEQHGSQVAGLELPHRVGGGPEGQMRLCHQAAGGWRQEMGMEGIDANAQGLEGSNKGSHCGEGSSITRCYGVARASNNPQLRGG